MNSKRNYDSDFCGSLPLSHINVIQSYGYLVVLDKASLNIIQISDNVTGLLGKPAAELVNTPLANFGAVENITKLQERFDPALAHKVPVTLNLNGQTMQALLHFKAEYLILELEKSDNASERSFTLVYEEVKYAMAAIEQASTIDEVSRIAVHELRKIAGFDGIMMYRFDSDWNGTVIAEEKVTELDNYMGHTFPASDVPKQARQLYLSNPYRLIPDRDYTPVRLYPVMNPKTHAFIDLADCNLRGVAAVHLEYLKNMNVQASMSIRVLHQGQLWGLIACHHLTPRYLNFELCGICELLSSVISNKISTIIYKENFETNANLQNKQTALIAQVYAESDLLKGILHGDDTNLMDLLNAGGVAAMINGRPNVIGEVPDNSFLENMVLWLQNKNIDKVYVTDQLPEVYDDAQPFAGIASGALVMPVDRENGDYIIAFRPEVIQTIKWGGDPNQAINFEPGSKNYHPRNSFNLWQQTVRNTAIAWTDHELAVAEGMRSFIYEFTTRKAQY